jgi:hypothetical protein
VSREWPEPIRRRKVADALRLYARLLVEHERVRRLGRGKSPSAAARCRPAAPAWGPLHEVAFFRAEGRRVAPLSRFCSRFPEADVVPKSVPRGPYLEALRVGVELAGDAIVQHGGEPPWGAGEPRAPDSPEAFDAICRELRDRDAHPSARGSLAAILDAADLRPVRPAAPRVLFDAAEYVLAIGGVAIALPEGQERDFFRALVAASKVGRVVPLEEHERVWKGAVDRLRKRIQKATGRSLLRHVVVSARRPVCGYRLNPNVELRYASEPGLRFVRDLDALDPRAPRRRPRRPREDD